MYDAWQIYTRLNTTCLKSGVATAKSNKRYRRGIGSHVVRNSWDGRRLFVFKYSVFRIQIIACGTRISSTGVTR